MTIVFNVAEFILVLAAAIVFQSMTSSDDKAEWVGDWSSDGPNQSRKDTVFTLAYVCSTISLLILFVSSLSKRCCLRCIPCINYPIPSVITRVSNHIMQALSIGLATVIVFNST